MDTNDFALEEMVKFKQWEMEKKMEFIETYKLYADTPRKRFCVQWNRFKICIALFYTITASSLISHF
ncbi:hypothetical protein [Peribacillus glennii]|uniref:Uncharacterized protein n=1 Tax=Peribacillus glennii TaxID=2303991 RepID=A0A372L764_9BACI|nr:hypothetical protein [Peribacillus glennii]RFU61034.1 hypothetical protein D0466_19620 [Peribacillus glennii]